MLRLTTKTKPPASAIRALCPAFFVGFVLLAALAPSHTLGSCGDYLVVQGERQMLNGHANAAKSNVVSRTSEWPARQPCNGPQCRNRSSVPATPVPQAPSTGQSKQATACGTADAIVACPFSGTTTDQTAQARSGFPSDVLRPPRISMLTSRS